MSDAVGRARPRGGCRNGERPITAASSGTASWSEGLRPGSMAIKLGKRGDSRRRKNRLPELRGRAFFLSRDKKPEPPNNANARDKTRDR
jgi:hypothetical protein